MAVLGFFQLQDWTDSFDGAFCASLSPEDEHVYRLLYVGGPTRSKVLYCEDHSRNTTAFVDIAKHEERSELEQFGESATTSDRPGVRIIAVNDWEGLLSWCRARAAEEGRLSPWNGWRRGRKSRTEH